MRTYYDIQLTDRTIAKRELEGEAIVKAGRYLIAKTLLDLGPPDIGRRISHVHGPFGAASLENVVKSALEKSQSDGKRKEWLLVWAGDENIADTAVPDVRKLPGSLTGGAGKIANAAPGVSGWE